MLLELDLSLRRPGFQLTVETALDLQGVCAVFGRSGAGKTTFLRCLAGLEAGQGRVVCGGSVWQDTVAGTFVPVHRRSLSYVFQEPRLFAHLNVRRNLGYGMRRRGRGRNGVSFDDVVALLGLQERLDAYPGQLSLGEQQRVNVGRAVLCQPDLLLLDEPLSALDLFRKREVLPFLRRLTRELTIPMVYVTHSVQEVLHLATSMLLMDRGAVVAQGPVASVFNRFSIQHQLDELAGSVLEARVDGHEMEYNLTRLALGGQHLYVPYRPLDVGSDVRVHVLARDVSVATEPLQGRTSVLNILRGSIAQVDAGGPASHAARLVIDVGVPLLAAITRKSLQKLALEPGREVYAQVKAVSLGDDLLE